MSLVTCLLMSCSYFSCVRCLGGGGVAQHKVFQKFYTCPPELLKFMLNLCLALFSNSVAWDHRLFLFLMLPFAFGSPISLSHGYTCWSWLFSAVMGTFPWKVLLDGSLSLNIRGQRLSQVKISMRFKAGWCNLQYVLLSWSWPTNHAWCSARNFISHCSFVDYTKLLKTVRCSGTWQATICAWWLNLI